MQLQFFSVSTKLNSFEDDAWGGKHLKLDYNKVLRWVKQRPNKSVKKQAHTLPDSKGNRSDKDGRLWVINLSLIHI